MNFNQIIDILLSLFNVELFLFMIIGVVFGILIGALPGLSVTLGVALALPFTFGMDPKAGLLLLLGIYCAGTYGGSITAILLKTPGTPASTITAYDGFALASEGKGYEALSMSLYASVIGGFLSGLSLLFLAPLIANFALSIGSPEYFLIILFSLTVIAGLGGASIAKGLAMAAFGMLISTIGIDPIAGNTRFIFDSHYLISGIEIVPALIGLFAISEVFEQISKKSLSITNAKKVDKKKFGIFQVKPYSKTILKSTFIGIFFGAMPGIGGATASAVAYNEAKQKSDTPEKFGKGALDGVAASESANNGTTGATLIPMMTLGIPGDIVTAVLLGALLVQGLSPGPQLFANNGDFAYAVMFGFILVNVVLFIIAKPLLRWFVNITIVPSSILFPFVLILCLLGSYAVTNTLYAVVISLIFGILGFILPKFGFPIIPILIGMILGPLAESSLRQSLILSDGSFLIFFQRPISIGIIIVGIFVFLFPLIKNALSARKA